MKSSRPLLRYNYRIGPEIGLLQMTCYCQLPPDSLTYFLWRQWRHTQWRFDQERPHPSLSLECWHSRNQPLILGRLQEERKRKWKHGQITRKIIRCALKRYYKHWRCILHKRMVNFEFNNSKWDGKKKQQQTKNLPEMSIIGTIYFICASPPPFSPHAMEDKFRQALCQR